MARVAVMAGPVSPTVPAPARASPTHATHADAHAPRPSLRQVPILIDGDTKLVESMVIVEYLESQVGQAGRHHGDGDVPHTPINAAAAMGAGGGTHPPPVSPAHTARLGRELTSERPPPSLSSLPPTAVPRQAAAAGRRRSRSACAPVHRDPERPADRPHVWRASRRQPRSGAGGHRQAGGGAPGKLGPRSHAVTAMGAMFPAPRPG